MNAARAFALLLAVPLAACDPEPDLPDPTIVEIQAGGAAFVLVQQADGAVIATADGGQDELGVAIRGPYAITRVCVRGAGFDVRTVLAGDGDLEVWRLECEPAGEMVTITSAQDRPLEVHIGPAGAMIGESDQLAVPRGEWDLVALDRPVGARPRILLQRDVQITGPVELQLDAARDAVELSARDVTVLGAEGAATTLRTRYQTSLGTEVWIEGEPGVALRVPETALAAGDSQEIEARTELVGYGSRWARTAMDAAEIELPRALADADLALDGAPSAWWTDDRDWSERTLEVVQWRGAEPVVWTTTAAPGWTEDMGDGALEPPALADIAGWEPRWEITPSLGYSWTLSLGRAAPDGTAEGVTWRSAR